MKCNRFLYITSFFMLLNFSVSGCVPEITTVQPNRSLPEKFSEMAGTDSEVSATSGIVEWREYFADSHLISLIEEALERNQELRITLQEIEILKNEASARQGAYLPTIDLGAGAGIDKVGEYTRDGAVEENLEIEHGKSFPDPLPEFDFGLHASWELDIWRKLRNAEKSAIMRYLASVEGRRFVLTNLIAEIANSYFELLALDSQLGIVRKNIGIQTKALNTVRLQKQGAKVTELALQRFEAQLSKTKSLEFEIQQKIIETENKLNFLLGRYPQPVVRSSRALSELIPAPVKVGVPTELLQNRPDMRQAELELQAAHLDIDVARADFYPSLSISGHIGYAAYSASKLIETPESLAYSLGAGLTAPLMNRREIEARYLNAGAKQAQAALGYERTLLRAFIEVANQISNIQNLEQSSNLKAKQVQALEQSVDISITLFNAARADYIEVLLTQREALEARLELLETRVSQLKAAVEVYRSLGGGWRDSSSKMEGLLPLSATQSTEVKSDQSTEQSQKSNS